MAILFGYYGATQSVKIKSSEILQRYSLYIAWIIILTGLLGLFNFFGIGLLYICLSLISINLLLRIGSYLFEYQDGKSVFQFGFYISIIFLFSYVISLYSRNIFFDVFTMFWIFNLGVVGFIIYILGIKKEIEKYMWYKLFILMIGTIILIIIQKVGNFYLALTLNSLLLTGIYFIIYKILQNKPQTHEKQINFSVRRILAGERITEKQTHFRSEFTQYLYEFIDQMPKFTKQILEFVNVLLIIALIVYYVLNIASFADINHVFYRLIIAIFVSNVLLLKRIGYNSLIQNLAMFLVINFAIYVSLFSYFNGDLGSIVTWGIFWNIFSASMIFYVHRFAFFSKIFNKIDYSYRIVATIIAMIVNLILLAKTDMPGELIFFLILLYLGLQGMILFYAIKYVEKIGIQKI
ncbi:MAG: hypothetical protein WC872_03770 [Candidatus Absconditabacterales bacterium]